MTDPSDIPQEELGVERDISIDYHSRLVATIGRLDQMYAELDGYADGEFADAPTSHLRDAQEHLAEARELMDSEKSVVMTRIDAIEEQIERLGGDE